MELRRIIVPDFPQEVHGLWAVQYAGETSADFFKLLGPNGLWRQQNVLHDFFTANEADLISYHWASEYPKGVTIAVAELKTLTYVNDLTRELRKAANNALEGARPDFDQFFDNYHENQVGIKELNLSKKQFPDKGWLRLYAISICSTCYIITGGAIKLVKPMDTREHLIKEDQKINNVRSWLLENNVSDYDSFKDFITNG